MLRSSANVSDFFATLISDFEYDETTKAYILSIFDKYKTPEFDLSKTSITLLFFDAKASNDFTQYQTIGDWLLYSKSVVPEFLSDASPEYYITIGRICYLSCYKIMNGSWGVYKNLSDDFVYITNNIHKKFALR